MMISYRLQNMCFFYYNVNSMGNTLFYFTERFNMKSQLRQPFKTHNDKKFLTVLTLYTYNNLFVLNWNRCFYLIHTYAKIYCVV